METSSYFIKNKALFGSYPNQDTIQELIVMGVNIFVDSTCEDENLEDYSIPDIMMVMPPKYLFLIHLYYLET